MGLKEQIADYLGRHPDLLNMQVYMYEISWKVVQHDLAGHILRASGYHIQKTDNGEVRLPLNAPDVERKWIEYEMSLGGAKDLVPIAALARQIWAERYDEKQAKELPFYDEETENVPGTRFWDDLEDVEAQHVIDFLEGHIPYNLNGPYDAEE